MAPAPSRPEMKTEAAMYQQRGPPPIPFKKENFDKPGNNTRDLFVTISLRTDPANPESSTFEQKVRTFSQGTAEEFIRWRIAFNEVIFAKPIDNGLAKVQMAKVLLAGTAWDKFMQSVHSVRVEVEDDNEEIFEAALLQLNKRYVPLDGLAKQKAYMRYQLRLGSNGLKPFVSCLLELNNYLTYFPGAKYSSRLPDDELIEIIDRAKPLEWHVAMLAANIEPSTMSLQEVTEYFERLEIMEKLRKQSGLKPAATTTNQSNKKNKKRGATDSSKSNDKHCDVCDTNTHNTVDCFVVKKARKMGKKQADKAQPTYAKLREELNMLKTQMGKEADNKAPTKARASDVETSGDESVYNMDEVSHQNTEAINSAKRQKLTQRTTEVIAEITDRHGLRRVLRILLDTGTSATIILAKFTAPNSTSTKLVRPTTWTTMGGNFITRRKSLIKFTLPEFYLNRVIQYSVHVDDSTDASQASYDMIIGRDLMSELALDISFTTHTIIWEGTSVPMKIRGSITDREIAHELMLSTNEGTRTKDATSRAKRILDSNYKAADLRQITDSINTINPKEKQIGRAHV